MTPGITDTTYNRFVELCDDYGVSLIAQEALMEFIYEIYYIGYDTGFSVHQQQEDLRKGIDNWRKELQQREAK